MNGRQEVFVMHFYASPQFPRLLNPEAIKDAIGRGVAEGLMAYVGKSPKSGYEPFYYKKPLSATGSGDFR